MLAGFNVPISEDLMIIVSGVLAGTVVPQNTYKLFAAVFLGSYLSDWVSYGLGRKFGKHLWDIPWLARCINREKLSQVEKYFEKHGFLTLLFGRFIPFGVRNCIFLTAGMGRMPFLHFIIGDGIACFLSNTVLFSLAYTFAENYELIIHHTKAFNTAIFIIFALLITAFFVRKYLKRKNKKL